MIQNQYLLDLNRELFLDNFAGGGGASTGIELALGRPVDHAINHNRMALGMHRINHPQTVHHCEDIFAVDPAELAEGRPVGGSWNSPDCTHFSKARGGKPVSKRIRGLAYVIFRQCKLRVRVIYMENVEEIQTWSPLLRNGKPDPRHKGRTWKAFLGVLTTGIPANHPDLPEMLEVLGDSVTRAELIRGFGYQVEFRELRACDFGAPTIRKRLFLIARCDGRPIVWPEPTHFSPKELPAARQRIGRTAKPWRTIAECIDWTMPVNSIFLSPAEAKKLNCKRPLVEASERRIATGIDRYVLKAKKPFLFSLTHQGGDRLESVDEPARVITGAHRGEKAVVNVATAPFIEEHANASGQRTMSADEPMRTLCAQIKGGHFGLAAATMIQKGHLTSNSTMTKGANEPMRCQTSRAEHAVVAASLCREFGESVGQPVTAPAPTVMPGGGGKTSLIAANLVKLRGEEKTHPHAPGLNEPIHTISAGGKHHGVSCAYLAQHNGGFNTTPGHAASEPLSTISSKGSQQQVVTGSLAVYYGSETDGQALNESMRTVTGKPRFGMALADAVAPVMTPDQVAGARRVAVFLRKYGVEFEGEFATVGGFVIVDIGMRMLTPRELFRAQGFPDEYVIDQAWVINPRNGEITQVALTKEQQIKMCGNSVCPPVARALVRANSPDMIIGSPQHKRRSHPIRPQRTTTPTSLTLSV